jgi:hypothetical protein
VNSALLRGSRRFATGDSRRPVRQAEMALPGAVSDDRPGHQATEGLLAGPARRTIRPQLEARSKWAKTSDA